MKPVIRFFCQNLSFKPEKKKEIRAWLMTMIREENKKPGEINFIFCDDTHLLNLNQTFLKHNTLTDILTFPNTEKSDRISGDIFISIQRVSENAEIFKQSFDKELYRVIAHGVLHLIGYQDKKKADKGKMTLKEDHYLQKILI